MRAFYSKATIRFEAKRGWSYLSDIAIDDIMLRIRVQIFPLDTSGNFLG